jgi:type I restriction enzyme M protein
METRVLKVFTEEDIAKIQETVQSWKTGEGYQDVAGFCKSVSLDEIEKNGFVLTPGRYVGALEVDDDGIDFDERLSSLSSKLNWLLVKSKDLDKRIEDNLRHLTGV